MFDLILAICVEKPILAQEPLLGPAAALITLERCCWETHFPEINSWAPRRAPAAAPSSATPGTTQHWLHGASVG